MSLKPAERDELLIRMDERLKGIKDGDAGDIPEILRHLVMINTTNLDQEVKIIRNKDRIGLVCKIGGAFITILATGAIAGVLQLLGIIKLGIF